MLGTRDPAMNKTKFWIFRRSHSSGENPQSTGWQRLQIELNVMMGFAGGSVVKNLSANVGDVGLIPGLGRSSRVGHGSPLHSAWKILWTGEPGEL